MITEHNALFSKLNENRSNKPYNRLSRWIGRLLPYTFTIKHMPGAKRVRSIIFSGTFAKAKKIFAYDENFVVVTNSTNKNTFKQIIQTKSRVLRKFNNVNKYNTPSTELYKVFAPRTPICTNKSSQLKNKLIASQLPNLKYSLSITSQFSLPSNHHNVSKLSPKTKTLNY